MLKILYLNHNTWNYVLQRSQILALELDKYFECTILDIQFIPRTKYGLSNVLPNNYHKVWQLRGGGKIHFIKKVNSLLYKLQLLKYREYDCVWICHPSFYKYIAKHYSGCLIYDCMDNHSQLCRTEEKDSLANEEKTLVSKSDIRIVSSENLKKAVPGMSDAVLVRNGFIAEDIHAPKEPIIKDKYTIGYFGAIESWMDFNLLLSSTNNDIEYRIIGPLKTNKFDVAGISYSIGELNERNIHFEGLINHDVLWDAVQEYDALIMPFVVNELILSVDPVKLYEYIAFGKCVISVWYPEINRFEPYVYFYHSQQEFMDLLNDLTNNGFKPKYDKTLQEKFLKENTWSVRGEKVRQIIENYFAKGDEI